MMKFSKPRFRKTRAWLKERGTNLDIIPILNMYGAKGVVALRKSTPKDTSEAANAWSYKVTRRGDVYKIHWINSVMAGNVPLVVILQYGHATGNGGFVHGRDFINPSLDPIFQEIKLAIALEVTS